jgi:hypothetical protein
VYNHFNQIHTNVDDRDKPIFALRSSFTLEGNMAYHNSVEEKQFIKLLEKTPLEESERAALVERIQTNGLNDDIIESMRTGLANAVAADKLDPARLNQFNVELARIIQRWRLSSQLNHGRRH